MSILKESISVGGLKIHNRLVLPPMATERSEGGYVSDPLCSYYDEKTAGGHIGLVITEHSYITPQGKASPGQLSAADDGAVDGLKRLTEIIHKNGSAVFAQINHAGGAAKREVTGLEVIGPSVVPYPRRGTTPDRAVTRADMDDIVAAFAQAARRVKASGFDGVEIHSAHGYLLNQFYSPLVNCREDEYGPQNMENRLRLHMRVIEGVRDAVGADYPVALRLGGCDYAQGGSTIEDAVAACVMLEKAGIDLLDISGGMWGYVIPGLEGEGFFAPMTRAIRDAVSIPVILTGGVVTGAGAEGLLARGQADMIGVGRAILQDSGWAARAMAEI